MLFFSTLEVLSLISGTEDKLRQTSWDSLDIWLVNRRTSESWYLCRLRPLLLTFIGIYGWDDPTSWRCIHNHWSDSRNRHIMTHASWLFWDWILSLQIPLETILQALTKHLIPKDGLGSAWTPPCVYVRVHDCKVTILLNHYWGDCFWQGAGFIWYESISFYHPPQYYKSKLMCKTLPAHWEKTTPKFRLNI